MQLKTVICESQACLVTLSVAKCRKPPRTCMPVPSAVSSPNRLDSLLMGSIQVCVEYSLYHSHDLRQMHYFMPLQIMGITNIGTLMLNISRSLASVPALLFLPVFLDLLLDLLLNLCCKVLECKGAARPYRFISQVNRLSGCMVYTHMAS